MMARILSIGDPLGSSIATNPGLAVWLGEGDIPDPERLGWALDPQARWLVASSSNSKNPDIGGGRFETVSIDSGGTWWGDDAKASRDGVGHRFRAFHRGEFVAEIRTRSPDRATRLAALAAIAIQYRLGRSVAEATQAIEDCPPVSRVFEPRGSYRGVIFVDDEAVSPRGISEAMEMARVLAGRRRLWVAFAAIGPPCDESANALGICDRLILVASAGWAMMLGDRRVEVRAAADVDEALKDLDRHLEPGDVLLTLGSAEVGTISDAFLRRLPRDRQGR